MPRGGARSGAGRKKGVPSQITTDLKQMILRALDVAGGPKYLAEQAVSNPNAFMTLLGKVLPATLVGDPNAPLQSRLEVSFVQPRPADED